MKPLIRPQHPLGTSVQPDFVQSILGKYGISRWQRQFKALILRRYPELFAEPAAAEGPPVINARMRTVIRYHHFHTSIIQQVPAATPNRLLTVNRLLNTQINHSYNNTINDVAERSVEGITSGSVRHPERFRERVRELRTSSGSTVLTVPALPAWQPQGKTGSGEDREPGSAALQKSRAEAGKTGETPESPAASAFRLKETLKAAAFQASPGTTGERVMPPDRKQPLHGRAQRLTLARVGESRFAGAAERQLRLLQAYGPERGLPAPATGVPPAAGGTMAQLRLAVPKLRETGGSRAQEPPHPDARAGLPGRTPALRPGAGLAAAATLAAHALPRAAALLQLPPPETRQLPEAAPAAARISPQMPLRGIGARGRGAARAGLAGAAEPWPLTAAPARPRGQSRPPAEPADASGPQRSLILRRPESKAAQPKRGQPEPEAAPYTQAAAAPKMPAAATEPVRSVNLGADEISRLADRVFQVLEKKLAIRNDRRGLR
ncbi:hypothetical protein [Paenibacillus macerans]|uniref:hypothetical protein n=1 Tax=Paenibacillus macerans TaxID=44252 RepID=UPI00203A8128|nr:hypothetical protein [Paenibacillus macerans]MCM3702377.1 hypothetical protein [Paenibacillus macerans]